MVAAVDDGDGAHEPARPGLADARSAAAVPLIVGRDVLGVLYLESDGAERVRRRRPRACCGSSAPMRPPRWRPAARLPPGSRRGTDRDRRPPLELVYYQADDTVLCDSAYVVKGAPGRILWSMLKAHAESGRTEFSNRELRLDESLELPAGNDNLEARLLAAPPAPGRASTAASRSSASAAGGSSCRSNGPRS